MPAPRGHSIADVLTATGRDRHDNSRTISVGYPCELHRSLTRYAWQPSSSRF